MRDKRTRTRYALQSRSISFIDLHPSADKCVRVSTTRSHIRCMTLDPDWLTSTVWGLATIRPRWSPGLRSILEHLRSFWVHYANSEPSRFVTLVPDPTVVTYFLAMMEVGTHSLTYHSSRSASVTRWTHPSKRHGPTHLHDSHVSEEVSPQATVV